MTEQPIQKEMVMAAQPIPPAHPHVIVDNTIHEAEEQYVNRIAASEKPLIIITDNYKESVAAVSSMIEKAFPHVPVIFETEATQKQCQSGRFLNTHWFRTTCVGHFAEVADDFSKSCPKNVQDSDCIIVLGTPKQHTKNMLSSLQDSDEKDIFETDTSKKSAPARVNFSLMATADRNIQAWQSWSKKVRGHGLCI